MKNDEASIEALFSAYGAAFDDADVDAVTNLFAYPAVIWQLGGGNVFDDEEDLAENVEALMDVFDEAGIVVTTPETAWLQVAGDSAAALVAWRQEDENGAVLHAFRCHYLLVRRGEDWRLAAIGNVAAEEPLDA